MHFVHSSIIPQSEIEFCTVFDARLPREVDILLLYHKFILISTLQIQKKDREMIYKSSPPMYIETPLLWATVVENHLISVSSSKKLLITETGSSTGKVAEIDLNSPIISENDDFKFFSISKDKSYILISTGSEQFFCVDISKMENPRASIKIIEKTKILSIGSIETGFVLLTENEENEKKLVFYDAKTRELTTEEVDQDVTGIIESDPTSKQQYCLIKEKSIENASKQVVVNLEERIICFTNISGDSFAFQTESGTLYSASAVKEQINAINTLTRTNEEGETITIDTPKITQMWNLPCDTVLCSLENGKNIIVSLQKPTQQGRKKVPQHFKFIELEQHFACHTLVNSNNKVYGVSEDGISLISENILMEKAEEIAKTEQKMITQITDESIVALGSGKTELLTGSCEFCADKEAQMFVTFRKTIFAVADKQIINPDGEVVIEFDSPVKMVASTDFRLIVVTGTNSLSLFNESFEQRDDITLSGEITAVAITDHYFAAYCYDSSPIVKNGNLSLFNFEFERICPDVHLPSSVTSLCFGKNKSELVAACSNGSLLRIPVSKYGVLPYITMIHAGKGPAKIIPIINNDRISIVTFGNAAYLLYDDRIMDLGITDFDSICASEVDDIFNIYLLKGGEVSSVPYDYKARKQYREPLENTENVVDIKALNDRVFFVRQTAEGAVTSMLYKDGIISSDPIDRSASSICVTQHLSEFFVLVGYEEPEPCICLFVANNESVKKKWETKLTTAFTSFVALNDALVIATEGRLSFYSITEEKLEITRGICQIDKKITSMEWFSSNIWCTCDDGSIDVLFYNERAERFELVSRTDHITGVDCLTPIDDITVAAGCANGCIHILRLPTSRALGYSEEKKIEKLSINIDLPILSIVKVNQAIVYIAEGFSIGALVPFHSTNDFCLLQSEQDKLREQYQAKYGFCIPSKNSLSSQYMVVDSTLFEASVERQNIKDEELQKLKPLLTANSLLISMRRNLIF